MEQKRKEIRDICKSAFGSEFMKSYSDSDADFSIILEMLQKYEFANHTDPEFQAIVQGLEVSSPSFRAILGVLFCDYDVSQGLRG